MHLIQFREIMRDAEVAYAIHPIVRRYLLTVEDATKALIACGVPRAANVAQIVSECLARGDSAPTVEAAIPFDNPVSKNN